jgi:hypothetical protein
VAGTMSGEAKKFRDTALDRRLKSAVSAELARILQSEPFRDSKRCRDFLQHVVQMTLKGRRQEIKEREIGIHVFGRDPAYSTSDDSIVRVKANEVRKKLAEYRLMHGDAEVQIELPRGGYAPDFSWINRQPVGRTVGSAVRFRVFAAVVCAVTLGVLMWAWFAGTLTSSPLQEFWAPVLGETNPVLICLAHPVVYHLSPRVHEQYRARSPANRERGPYAIALEPNEILGQDVIPVPDQYVGVGDAQAAVLLASTLKGFGKITRVRIGHSVSFPEIRNYSTILVGAFTNRWTLEVMDELRFVFDFQDGMKVVRDRLEGKTWFIPNLDSTGKVPVDYAIASRIFDSKSGQIVISVAGITQYGTQAAGEFLCQPEQLAVALRSASANWPKKNLQFVLETNVIGSAPGPSRVIATHIW